MTASLDLIRSKHDWRHQYEIYRREGGNLRSGRTRLSNSSAVILPLSSVDSFNLNHQSCPDFIHHVSWYSGLIGYKRKGTHVIPFLCAFLAIAATSSYPRTELRQVALFRQPASSPNF